MKKTALLFLLFTAFTFLFVAVPTNAQESLPTLEIVFPTEGYVFEDANNLKISFETENFLFVDFKNNREPFPGNDNAGHAHLWVVGGLAPLSPISGELSLNHDDAEKILQDFRPIDFTVEGPGKYTAVIELTQNHHKTYAPPVRAEVNFVVGSTALQKEVREALSADSIYLYSIFVIVALLLVLAGFKIYKR